MTKKLKITFVKFEKALFMQVLEQEGDFKEKKHSLVRASPALDEEGIYLRGRNAEWNEDVRGINFANNAERDKYFNDVVKWISEEQFKTSGKLEIGKVCEVSSNKVDWDCRIFAGKTAKQLGEPRYIAFGVGGDYFVRWKYARPIGGCIQPKIDGDVYTWEMEVADER